MKVTEIWIYPVKSLGGIRVKRSKVFGKGLEYDRRYMLVDAENKFITQRVYPQLALFKLSLAESSFRVTFHSDVLDIPLVPTSVGTTQNVAIWDDHVETFELGERYNQWFSERAGIPCRLVYFPENNRRSVDKNFAMNGEQVSLADGYPFLVIGQASLDDLNARLDGPVPMNRFRPNFVFEGGSPFDEDKWKNFSIGTNRFAGLKLCARCVLTTVNQDTGIKGTEPLATLSTFRKQGSKVNFGQNLVAIDYGEVFEGDVVRVDQYA